MQNQLHNLNTVWTFSIILRPFTFFKNNLWFYSFVIWIHQCPVLLSGFQQDFRFASKLFDNDFSRNTFLEQCHVLQTTFSRNVLTFRLGVEVGRSHLPLRAVFLPFSSVSWTQFPLQCFVDAVCDARMQNHENRSSATRSLRTRIVE